MYNKKSIENKLPDHLEHFGIESKDIELIQLLCSLFVSSNTNLVIPALITYYIYSIKKQNFDKFIEIMKALAAFLILRRATTTDTAQIDNCFRDLMNKKSNYEGLSLGFKDDHILPDVNQIKTF